MTSKDLTRDQGKQVFLETRDILGRVHQLVVRMQERGFATDDPVYASSEAAWHALIEMNKQWQLVSLGGSWLGGSCVGASPQPHDQPQPNG